MYESMPKRQESTELSEEERELVLAKVQDINEEGTAFTVVGGIEKKNFAENCDSLKDIFKDGLLGAKRQEGESRKDAWVRGIKERKTNETSKEQNSVWFNILGKTLNAQNKEILRNINESSYAKKPKSLSLIFDTSRFKQVDDNDKRYLAPNTYEKALSDEELPEDDFGYTLAYRVPPRLFKGLVINIWPEEVDFDQLPAAKKDIIYKNAGISELAKIMKDAAGDKKENLVPIYDNKGNLWWPEKKSHKEIVNNLNNKKNKSKYETSQDTTKEQEPVKVPNKEAAVEEKVDISQKVEEQAGAKYAELTGKDPSAAEDADLYRDMVRDKFKKIKWISSESDESLKSAYKRMGEVAPLGTIKGNFDKYVEGEFGKVRDIPEEAVEIENKALAGIGAVEDGFIDSLAYQKYLDGEINNAGMEKLKRDKGLNIDIESVKKPSFDAMNESVKQIKSDLLLRIVEWKSEGVSSLPPEAQRLRELIDRQKSQNPELTNDAIFENFSKTAEADSFLRDGLVAFKNMGKSAEEIKQEKARIKAELLGIRI